MSGNFCVISSNLDGSKPSKIVSNSIVVDGELFALNIKIKESYILVGIERSWPESLRLERRKFVQGKIVLVHTSDRSRDREYKFNKNCQDKANGRRIFGKPLYKIENLDQDGFVHPDDSLHFEFFISKNNYLKQI